MIFLARMLGFANTILGLIPKEIKIFISILILLLGCFLIVSKTYYNKGVSDEKAKWELAVKLDKEKSDKISTSLDNFSVTFGGLVETLNFERKNKEIIRENRINTIIQQKPIYKDCKVDKEIVDEQNALKALGPKP